MVEREHDGHAETSSAELLSGVEQAFGEMLVDKVRRRYEGRDSKHHTFGHVTDMLAFAATREPGDWKVVAGAILYHDIVYHPEAEPGWNEQQSAWLAKEELAPYLTPEQLEKVVEYILATAEHEMTVDDPDLALFLDADMAVLGAEPETYDRYAANIREEYGHVPDDLYRPGRTAVLQGFLDREHIYCTQSVREELEDRARENIARELRVLEASA